MPYTLPKDKIDSLRAINQDFLNTLDSVSDMMVKSGTSILDASKSSIDMPSMIPVISLASQLIDISLKLQATKQSLRSQWILAIPSLDPVHHSEEEDTDYLSGKTESNYEYGESEDEDDEDIPDPLRELLD